MPVLKDFRQTKDVVLEQYENARVTVYSALLMRDAVKFDENRLDDPEHVLSILPCLIKDWDFTDEAGAILPINKENIEKLTPEAVNFIVSEIAALMKLEKKS